MGNVYPGANLEFSRHHDKSFEWAVEKAAEMGYKYVEPMVHWGRELMSEAGYYHTVSMLDDPFRIKRACDDAGVAISALSAHAPLCRPEIGLEYTKQAIRFAAEIDVPIICTYEGEKAQWTTEEEDFVLLRYTLKEAALVAEPRNVIIGLETHSQYSASPEGMDRLADLVDSPAIAINFDTGNTYLCGHDPHEWLEQCLDRVVHLHAKDIAVEHSEQERGKVTGTPVGCACGDGVVDWKRIVEICKKSPRDLVLSVECGTVEQAEKSLEHLNSLI
jgi:sugar phosphate isomerase/epimerase